MKSGHRWLRRRRTLSAQLLTAQVAVLVLAGVVGYLLWARTVRTQLDHEYEQRALAIAEATASVPQVITALTTAQPGTVNELATTIAHNTGASYVVIIDRTGVRYSHPNPALIGKRIEEPVIALDGRGHVGVDRGSLGRSANGRAPVRAADGSVIGEVSAGVLETDVSAEAHNQLVSLAAYLALAFAAGLIVAVLLARRLKRQTFGLELDEIAALVQEREATLHGIREGVVAVGPAGRMSLVNDQAHHLLGTTPNDVGRQVSDVLPAGQLRTLLLGDGTSDNVTDRLVLHNGRFLVGSSRMVTQGGRQLGSVITLRDRTELEHALRELDDVRNLTDALRAQQHEFSNRMHVMSGLLELGQFDDAIGYASSITGATAGLAAELEASISNAPLVALLVAKTTVARERGVALTVSCDNHVDVDDAATDTIVTVLGNLIDNAIDAVTGPGIGDGCVPSVQVRLAEGEHELVMDVSDSGPGIPAGAAESIFTDGWSTKTRPGKRQRGLGLALVRQLVQTQGGQIQVREGSGARFRVILPRVAAGRP
jgi:two-component system, CitB family, sensor kinase